MLMQGKEECRSGGFALTKLAQERGILFRS
jgi:hypothetical protein